jgi:hypothetical protein
METMRDVLEVSYTGDLLAHRRCPRAWAYEKYARFQPYEQSQAMEGRLVHHAMEWLTHKYEPSTGKHVNADDLKTQLLHFYRVLWARGIRTAFHSKQETVDRVVKNLFPHGIMHPTVKIAIEGAKHTEYELKTVKKLVRSDFLGKDRLILTGILDLVIQTKNPIIYPMTWIWSNRECLSGEVQDIETISHSGDLEVWDYKGTQASTTHMNDYVIQLLTYAGLYGERTGRIPVRCVLFFINEPDRNKQLISIPIEQEIIIKAEKWTINEAKRIRQTALSFEIDPFSVTGGDIKLQDQPVGKRVDSELKKQCTACGFRFDCEEYISYLGRPNHPDIDILNVGKN